MPQDKIEISVEILEKTAVLYIRGDLTVAAEPRLTEAYARAHGEGVRCVLFSFKENAYIDSGGIAALLQVLVKVRERGQKAALANVSAHNRKMLNMVGVTRLADIYDTPERALADIDNWK